MEDTKNKLTEQALTDKGNDKAIKDEVTEQAIKEKVTEQAITVYQKDYSEQSFFAKIMKYAKIIGVHLVYKALLLYYVLQKPELSAADKAIIYAALGYLISPLDFIPDLTIGVGYTDDALAVALAFAKVFMYIDEDVRALAQHKLDNIFGKGTSESL